MSPLNFDGFREDLAAAEQAAAASRTDGAVREADLERRLSALNHRASNVVRRPQARPPHRDPVALYASRWSHAARASLLLAK